MQFRQQFDTTLGPARFLPVVALSALIYGSAARSDAPPPGEATISPADLASLAGACFHRPYAVSRGAGRGRPGPACNSGCQRVGIVRNLLRFDLKSLPIVRWSWRLDLAPPRTDERGQGGDDQGLRLSFLHRGGTAPGTPFFTIQYVWSQNEPVDATWANAFVPNAHEVAARSGPATPGEWRTEQRDLAADFRAAFGRDVDRIDAVCLMTDGDQTGALVEGWYGDIILQAR